jgi:L-aminopeptidase/D-esterase-like protein
MKRIVLILAFIISIQFLQGQELNKIRARDLGIPFDGVPGIHNAITDVPGVEVGYKTIISGNGKLVTGTGPIRTGVTIILPKGKTDLEYPMGYFIFNGNGEVTGIPFVHDFGKNKGPIGITNTYSVGVTRDAIGEWCFNHFSLTDHHDFRFGLPIVGETFDGGLNDINGLHIKKNDVFEAINNSKTGYIDEGNVGGGTGMVCYWFKGGTGTASRVIKFGEERYTVGVLVQANFGYRNHLMIRGLPVGRILSDTLMPIVKQDGSIIVIVGTDAPLSSSQLNLVAKRVTLGIGRTGTTGSSGSGDIFIAFSTQNIKDSSGIYSMKFLDEKSLNRIFDATVESTEEAIINALVAAKDMEGINGNFFYQIPHEKIKQYFFDYKEFFKSINQKK